MLTVGLTGGIATGKSYILETLGSLGCATIDADIVARQVVEPGKPAYEDIVRRFGREVLAEDGALDRARLGAIVFADQSQREALNAIVHPRVFEAQAKWLAETAALDPQAVAVVDAALMIETGSYRRFEKLIVAYCSPELQLDRLMSRNRLTRAEAEARIAAQSSTEEKLKYADYSIDTSLGFEDTRQQVERVHSDLRRLADLKKETL
jgi:dephospho-CoA kinase